MAARANRPKRSRQALSVAAASAFQGRRTALVAMIAATLLSRGLADVPLRELARQLDTSDRMLLYYFKDKAELTTAALSAVSAQLADKLQAALPTGRVGAADLLRQVTALLASKPIRPYMSIWADLVAHGTRGEQPFRAFMSASAAGWLERIEARLDMPEGAARRRVAAAILTIAEGSRMLEDALPGATRETLRVFVAGLEAQA